MSRRGACLAGVVLALAGAAPAVAGDGPPRERADLTCLKRTAATGPIFFALAPRPLPPGYSVGWRISSSTGSGPPQQGYHLTAGGGVTPAGAEIQIAPAPPGYDICQAEASWWGVRNPRADVPTNRPGPRLDRVVPPS